MNKLQIHDKSIEFIAGTLITIFFLWLQLTSNIHVYSFIQRIENVVYDIRYKSSLKYFDNKKRQEIVIVDIDEDSLSEIGRWPWSRKTMSNLLNKISEYEAVVTGFDIIFAESEKNIAKEVLSEIVDNKDYTYKYQEIISKFDYDTDFAKEITNKEVVLGYILHNVKKNSTGVLPKNFVSKNDDPTLSILEAQSLTGNIKELQNATELGGFTTSSRDIDGIIRRAPLVMRYKEHIYPSLALAMARSYLISNDIDIQISKIANESVIESVNLDHYRIPTDKYGRVLVPFIGKSGSFKYIKAKDLLNNTINHLDIAGKIVLVGTSALGLGDLQPTSIQSVYPGVEVHASIISGILSQFFPYEPIWAIGVNVFLIVLIGVSLTLIFPFEGPKALLLSCFTFISLIISTNVFVWIKYGFVIKMTLPVIEVVFLGICHLTYGYLFETRNKIQIKNMFGQYVSPLVVEQMSQDPDHYSFDGQSKHMTVLFADIRSFTSISEKLSANDLKNLLNRYFEPMTKIIFENNGTIDKYVGDMIMAFWGAPTDDIFQENNAILCALQMLDKTKELQEEFELLGLPKISIGIGINSGIMHVGDMGSKYRRSYTVLGDAVNLGSRLESLTKQYGVSLIVSNKTAKKCNICKFRFLDYVRVKGKNEPVEIFEPFIDDRDLTLHNLAFDSYKSQQFELSLKYFNELSSIYNEDKLYKIYISRIKELKKINLPKNWDGAYTSTSK